MTCNFTNKGLYCQILSFYFLRHCKKTKDTWKCLEPIASYIGTGINEIKGIIYTEKRNIWDKVFRDGPSKTCGRQPLKNWKGHGLLKQTIHLHIFLDCLSQILLSLFLNTLPHIALNPLASGIHKRSYILKSYLCYKSIFCHKVALDVQLIFLFEEKMFRSQHTLCCCEIQKLQNLWHYHRYCYKMKVTLSLISFES